MQKYTELQRDRDRWLSCSTNKASLSAPRCNGAFGSLAELTALLRVAAMSFLIPIGVVCYVAIGGLKATFTTSYMHTVIIYIVCLVLMFQVSNSAHAPASVSDNRRSVRVRDGSVQSVICPDMINRCCASSFVSAKFHLHWLRRPHSSHTQPALLQVFVPSGMLGGIDNVRPSKHISFLFIHAVSIN